MLFEQIEVGKCYEIIYTDPNYPCKCPCHASENIVHCVPCCYDMSYAGKAVCISKNDRNYTIFMAVNKRRYIILYADNVIKLLYEDSVMPGCDKVPMKPWFDVLEYMISFARHLLKE